MRIFKKFVARHVDRKVVELQLNEYDDFEELSSLSYEIQLTSDELKKYNKVFDREVIHIKRALQEGIHVYSSCTSSHRLTICGDSVFSSPDSVAIFSTTDESKYQILEDIVKDFINELT